LEIKKKKRKNGGLTVLPRPPIANANVEEASRHMENLKSQK